MEPESWKMDKEEAGLQLPEGPILCANNCGFFGSAATMNLCSQCYRDAATAQAKAAEAAGAMAAAAASPGLEQSARATSEALNQSVDAEVGGATPAVASGGQADPPPTRPPNRCFTCKKRVGLTGFKCKCGNQFCSLHRYHDKHDCSYDYRAAARDAIARANPVVKADKLDKI